MNIMKKIKTGIPGLDTLTTGGLPAARATLVVGRSGTGKTIFGLQTAAHFARAGVTRSPVPRVCAPPLPPACGH